MKNVSLTSALRQRGIAVIAVVLCLVIALAVIVGSLVFFEPDLVYSV